MEIESMGWDSFFDDRFAAFRAQGLVPARVVRESRHLYDVECGRGIVQAQASGRFLYSSDSRADFPTVGDWVACRDGGDVFLIEGLLPRKSRFSRKSAGETTEEQIVAANIDFLCVVCGLDGGRNFTLRGLSPLGVGLLAAGGALLGWLTYLASPSYRRRIQAHTRQAGMSLRQRWSAVALLARTFLSHLSKVSSLANDMSRTVEISWPASSAAGAFASPLTVSASCCARGRAW